jgi:DNA processing protein
MTLYLIALNAVKGLGPVRINQLLSEYDSPEELFKKPADSLRKTGFLTDAVIKQIQDPQLLRFAEEQLTLAEAGNILILTIKDDSYPQALKEIFAPPPVIYVKGQLDVFKNHGIAVVGMRQPGTYGKNATEHIVKDLVLHNIVIVSGLALGIDSLAHKACLDHGGKTVAVLGSGIDKIYPASNRGLAENIEEHGAILSEFPLQTEPFPYNFPRRNRIIAGLAAGVLVVEAGKKSGSLITAHYALQQGREVFAVPGPIFSEKSDGTFTLIKNGAVPVQSARDILDTIEIVTHPFAKQQPPSKAVQIPLELLSSEEQLIVETLSDTPQRIDQIAEKIEKKVADLFSLLLNLELKGMVKQVAGGQYIRM